VSELESGPEGARELRAGVGGRWGGDDWGACGGDSVPSTVRSRRDMSLSCGRSDSSGNTRNGSGVNVSETNVGVGGKGGNEEAWGTEAGMAASGRAVGRGSPMTFGLEGVGLGLATPSLGAGGVEGVGGVVVAGGERRSRKSREKKPPIDEGRGGEGVPVADEGTGITPIGRVGSPSPAGGRAAIRGCAAKRGESVGFDESHS